MRKIANRSRWWSWSSELELENGVGGGAKVRGRRADWRTRACCGPGVILTTSVKARVKARASKSCWWGARKLRVGRAGRAKASLPRGGASGRRQRSLSGEGLASGHRQLTTYFSKSPTASEIASAMRSWPAAEGCKRSLSALLKYTSCARDTG